MTTRTTYKATARHDGKWWFIHVPELDTAGQARKVSEIEEAARDVIGLYLDVEPNSFDVDLDIELPGNASLIWAEAKATEATAAAEQQRAAALARQAVQTLVSDGLSLTDAGVLLGLSTQRVHQLSKVS